MFLSNSVDCYILFVGFMKVYRSLGVKQLLTNVLTRLDTVISAIAKTLIRLATNMPSSLRKHDLVLSTSAKTSVLKSLLHSKVDTSNARVGGLSRTRLKMRSCEK